MYWYIKQKLSLLSALRSASLIQLPLLGKGCLVVNCSNQVITKSLTKSKSSIQYLIVFVSNINICLRTNQLYISFSNHKYTLLIFKLKVFYLNNPVTLIYISYLFKTCLILILLKSCYQLSTKDPKH